MQRPLLAPPTGLERLHLGTEGRSAALGGHPSVLAREQEHGIPAINQPHEPPNGCSGAITAFPQPKLLFEIPMGLFDPPSPGIFPMDRFRIGLGRINCGGEQELRLWAARPPKAEHSHPAPLFQGHYSNLPSRPLLRGGISEGPGRFHRFEMLVCPAPLDKSAGFPTPPALLSPLRLLHIEEFDVVVLFAGHSKKQAHLSHKGQERPVRLPSVS